MRLLVLIFGLVLTHIVFAQDSTYSEPPQQETIVKRKHSPAKATVFSAIVPGLGQVYNKKNWYWKVPIIYGLGGLLVYNISNSNKNYISYRDALFAREDTLETTIDTEFTGFSDSQVRTRKNFYKKQRDTNIIYLILLYSVNVIDATVEAHLFDFKVGEQYIMSLAPKVIPSYSPSVSNTYGLSLSLKFR